MLGSGFEVLNCFSDSLKVWRLGVGRKSRTGGLRAIGTASYRSALGSGCGQDLFGSLGFIRLPGA